MLLKELDLSVGNYFETGRRNCTGHECCKLSTQDHVSLRWNIDQAKIQAHQRGKPSYWGNSHFGGDVSWYDPFLTPNQAISCT